MLPPPPTGEETPTLQFFGLYYDVVFHFFLEFIDCLSLKAEKVQ